jgi:hypothetical protein
MQEWMCDGCLTQFVSYFCTMIHYIPIPIQTVSCAFCCLSLLTFVQDNK